MANFPTPPTFTDPIKTNPATGKEYFEPMWLQWFLDVARWFSNSGINGAGVLHETLPDLLGGAANDHYHLTAAQWGSAKNFPTQLILLDGGAPAHYWGVTVDPSGTIVTTDLGITPP